MNLYKLLCFLGIHKGEWDYSMWRKNLKAGGTWEYKAERYCSACGTYEEILLNRTEFWRRKNGSQE